MAAFSSLARALIAAFSSAVNPSFFLVGSLLSFRSCDNLREAVQPLQPRTDALEGIGHECASAGAADLLRRDELRLLEQPDVLLHPGQRHAEGLGQLADRRATGTEPFDDGAAGRVHQGLEGTIDGSGILNHQVHYNGCSQCGARPPRHARIAAQR